MGAGVGASAGGWSTVLLIRFATRKYALKTPCAQRSRVFQIAL